VWLVYQRLNTMNPEAEAEQEAEVRHQLVKPDFRAKLLSST